MLVEPEALEGRLGDPDLRVVDATWYLPAQGRNAAEEFAREHLPGAIHMDLSTDLADSEASVRNTIAAPKELARSFGLAGIGTEHHVVVYDRLGGFSAGRIWWALRLAGHPHTSLLNGGFTRWVAEGRPVTAELRRLPAARFQAAPRPELLASKSDVLHVLSAGETTIVDARPLDRFQGTGEEPTRYKGHIPGSVCIPHERNLDTDLAFRPADELRALYEEAGVRFDRPVITTCSSGVTASLSAFALTLLGHTDVRLYDGSWAEWGELDDVPHERS